MASSVLTKVRREKHQARLERVTLLKEMYQVYDALYRKDALEQHEVSRFLDTMRELEQLQAIEEGYNSIMKFGQRYFNNGRLLDPDTPSPPFHHEVSRDIKDALTDEENNSFLAFVAPRSHAKTVFAIVVTILWCVCYEIHPYFTIISNRQDGAKQILAMVKYELMNNDLLIKDFGDLYNKSAWSLMEIVTANGIKVQAAGSQDAIRGSNHLGSRPWVLMDDIEKDPDVLSLDYRDKVEDWFNQTVVPLGSPTPGGTKIIWVGTILHFDSVLNRVIKNDTRFRTKRFPAIISWPKRMELWEEWQTILLDRSFADVNTSDEAAQIAGQKAREFYQAHKAEMDEGSQVLWPERMPLYELMIIWATKRKAFLTEYSGDPRDETTILYNQFTHYDLLDIKMDDLIIYGAVDPSLGKTNKSDLSAIVTVGLHPSGLIFVLDVDAKRRSPDKIIADIMVKAQQFHYRGFAVETVQFQHLFKTDLEKRSLAEGVYLPIKEVKPGSDKWLRLASMEPLVTNGHIRFLKQHRELIDELEQIGTDGSLPRYDDRADALEMAVSLCKKGKRRISVGVA